MGKATTKAATLSERGTAYLEHLRQSAAQGIALTEYCRRHELRVEDWYQDRRELVRKGLISSKNYPRRRPSRHSTRCCPGMSSSRTRPFHADKPVRVMRRNAPQVLTWLPACLLLKRMKTCGSPGCRCATDPDVRHGRYYPWGHMKAGKLLHRLVRPSRRGRSASSSPTTGK